MLIKILYLYRRNIFDIVLSKAASKQEGVWHTFTEENREVMNSIEYDPIPIKWVEAEYHKLQKTNTAYPVYLKFKDIEYLELCYEDFLGSSVVVEDRLNRFKEILNFIEWEYIDSDIITDALHPKTKQHLNEHYEKVPNIEEVYRLRDSLTTQ